MVAGTSDSQLQLAFADRQAGVEASLAAAESVVRDDRARVEEALAALARTGEPWTADHVHEALADGADYDRNVVSSVMSHWSRQGWILTDWTIVPTPSTHRSRHGSRNRWWRGNLANPREDSRKVGDGALRRHGDAAVERHVSDRSPIGFQSECPIGIQSDSRGESPRDTRGEVPQ